MNEPNKKPHFHIHWNENDKLDWQCFETRDAANEEASYLKRDGETFRIIEVLDECPLLKKFG